MSVGICRKRLGFDDIVLPAASTKRPHVSPSTAADFKFAAPEDNLSVLFRFFPSMDRQVLESALNAFDHNLHEVIKSFQACSLSNESAADESANLNTPYLQILHHDPCPTVAGNSESKAGRSLDKFFWVDSFLQEMMNASCLDDVKERTSKFLETYEKRVIEDTLKLNETTMKEQLQCLLRESQLLKRAVVIQHQRSLEHEEKEAKEVQHLKNIISQYQDKVQTLEMNNYALRVHLQKAQESSSIPNRFHPDIF